MNLNRIVLDKIGEWFNWPQLSLCVFGGLTVILLFEEVIDFLEKLWTDKQSTIPDHRKDNRPSGEISSHDYESDWSTSATSSIESLSTNIIQRSPVEWNSFVPYKYLCSCRYGNSYLARKPIRTEYNLDSKYNNKTPKTITNKSLKF